jgi:hypothetical protein
MEYADYFETVKDGVYERVPKRSDAWGTDVWKGLFCPQITQAVRTMLRQHLSQKPVTDVGRRVFDDISADVFGLLPDGTSRVGIPDAVDAVVSGHLPALDDVDPAEVLEALELCIQQSSYKLYKWGTATQLTALGAICETVPRRRMQDYESPIRCIIGTATQAAAVMWCDCETKPNFRTLARRNKLLKEVKNVAEMLWDNFDLGVTDDGRID